MGFLVEGLIKGIRRGWWEGGLGGQYSPPSYRIKRSERENASNRSYHHQKPTGDTLTSSFNPYTRSVQVEHVKMLVNLFTDPGQERTCFRSFESMILYISLSLNLVQGLV